jgi:hypothetical protein
MKRDADNAGSIFIFRAHQRLSAFRFESISVLRAIRSGARDPFVVVGNGLAQGVYRKARAMHMILRQAAQRGYQMLRLYFKRSIQVSSHGQLAHCTGTNQRVDTAVGKNPYVGNGAAINPQRDFYGIPALADRNSLSARVLEAAYVSGLPRKVKELLSDLARQRKIFNRHFSSSFRL